MRKLLKDFKAFINRGNIVDMAVGVIIGSAFSKIVTSLVNDILMPLITWLFGANSLNDLSIVLKVDELGEPSLLWHYGKFLQTILDFLIVAVCMFIILKVFMNSQKMLKDKVKEAKNKKPTKEEKKLLKEQNVNMSNKAEVESALKALRDEKKKKEEAELKAKYKPTELDILKEIKELLKQNLENENKVTEEVSENK
ncbi:MAG: large conductance mechanosensitive channel protein MscL [Clostridia bacterium]|nr:large conductance mechanosensitive channel protein MscL [Clostridia bacterium]